MDTEIPKKTPARQIFDSVVSFARAFDICPEGDFRGRERIAGDAERSIKLILKQNNIRIPDDNANP